MLAHQRLEREWAEWNDLDPEGMVVCSSGTAALHLAWEALNPPGEVVDMADLNMVACPRSVSLARGIPRFVDCDDRLLIDLDRLSKSCDNLLVTHIYGRRVRLEKIEGTDVDYIVEDLAEAHGVRPSDDTDAACWSFYKNKIVHGEEGGAVWFQDPYIAKHARQLRSLGFTDAHDFDHVPRGHNYRLADCLAELVFKGLAQADENIQRRQEVEYWYSLSIPREWQLPARDAVWVYDLRIPDLTSERQTRIVRSLNEQGIAARHCFKPMTTLEEYRWTWPSHLSPNALRLSREVIYLPVRPEMTQAEVCDVSQRLLRAVGFSRQLSFQEDRGVSP